MVTATGGRAAWEAEHTGHLSGRVSAFGLSGTIEAWTARPDRSASATKLGPFTLLEGMDGAAAWRTDPSGKLQMLDGRDLVRARASVWFENENYLASDHGGGQIRWIATEKDSAGTFDVLEITPPAGDSRRYAFDAATGLLVRVTLKEDQQSALSTLSDYRPAGSRKVAYVTHTAIVNMPANALTVTLDSIEVNVPVDASHFAPPRTAAPGVRWLKQDGIARLAFQYRGRHVWLRASINGAQPADFLFDTGASITILDSAYAAKMGIETTGKMDAMGAGSSGGASFATLKSLRVAGDDGDGVELSDQKIGVLSVNGVLAPFFWRDCAGVLGYGFISQFVNEIDFDADTLVLRDPKSFEYHGAGTMIPMTLAGTVPVVRLKLDGSIEGDYRLDVGSNSTVDVHGPFAKKHALEGTTGKSLEVTGAGFGGQFTSRVVRMKRIEIGPYGWDRPIVSLSGATTGALASEDYAGNIGNQILERFKCTLDYDRHQVYLEPGQKYREPDHFSRAGVLLIKVNGVVRAGEVLKGSPAASAGLRKDDEVLSIDGKAALSCEPDDLARLFEEGAEGRKVVFEIKRGDKVKKLKVKLKEMI
ncbi:MAG: aspartyl protease family protein [Candidatus Eisenbacteria bacterium]|nr:aspartyl protease family protein [Candidatus Eisenbacteria bacterium]